LGQNSRLNIFCEWDESETSPDLGIQFEHGCGGLLTTLGRFDHTTNTQADSFAACRCGEQIKDDLEATFATCAEASPLPSAYLPPPCPPPPPPVRQPSLGDLAAMCLQVLHLLSALSFGTSIPDGLKRLEWSAPTWRHWPCVWREKPLCAYQAPV